MAKHGPRFPDRIIARLNLWTRLVLVLTIGFVMLFGVFSLVSLRVLDDSTQRILMERQVIAQMSAQQYDELLIQAYSELDKATSFAALDPGAPDLANENRLLAQAYDRLGNFSLGVVFLDAHGRVVLAEPAEGRPIGADYSGFPFIAQVMQTKQRNISDPFRDPTTGKPAVAVTIPVFDSRGELMSMLSGWIDLTTYTMLAPVEQARKLGSTGHAELVDEHGIVIASTEGYEDALTPGDHLQYYRRMLAANQSGVEDVPVDSRGVHAGEMHVMAFAPLTVAHWGMAVGGSDAETFAPVRELQRDIFAFGAISFVIIFVTTLLGARLLVQPVKVLTRAASQIAEGDLSSPVRLTTGGEIGMLAESFEAMRVRLQQSRAEITAWGSELETRVQERTRELGALNAELQRQEVERRQLLQRVIGAQEEERTRVARELHDETGQALTALLLSLDAVEANLPASSDPVREPLQRAKTLTQNALRELRAIIYDLRPSALDDLGLVPAIRRFAEERLESLDVRLTMETQGWPRERLDPAVETVLFRVMQEALNNIAQHADACSVRIALETNHTSLMARVDDDGNGFDPAAPRGRWGLIGMRERLNLIGGEIQVTSAPDRGTQIEIRIPREKRNQAHG